MHNRAQYGTMELKWISPRARDRNILCLTHCQFGFSKMAVFENCVRNLFAVDPTKSISDARVPIVDGKVCVR